MKTFKNDTIVIGIIFCVGIMLALNIFDSSAYSDYPTNTSGQTTTQSPVISYSSPSPQQSQTPTQSIATLQMIVSPENVPASAIAPATAPATTTTTTAVAPPPATTTAPATTTIATEAAPTPTTAPAPVPAPAIAPVPTTPTETATPTTTTATETSPPATPTPVQTPASEPTSAPAPRSSPKPRKDIEPAIEVYKGLTLRYGANGSYVLKLFDPEEAIVIKRDGWKVTFNNHPSVSARISGDGSSKTEITVIDMTAKMQFIVTITYDDEGNPKVETKSTPTPAPSPAPKKNIDPAVPIIKIEDADGNGYEMTIGSGASGAYTLKLTNPAESLSLDQIGGTVISKGHPSVSAQLVRVEPSETMIYITISDQVYTLRITYDEEGKPTVVVGGPSRLV